MGTIIKDWDGFIVEESGHKETTDLIDADYGFGNKLVTFLAGQQITSNSSRDANAKAFFKRPVNEQIFHGSYSDPQSFVRDLRRMAKGRKSEQEKSADININALPAVYFYRDLNFSIADGALYPPVKNFAEWRDDDGNLKAKIDKVFLSVNYNVHVLAWELSSLGRIANALSSQIITTSHRYPYKANVFGQNVTMNGELVIPREIEWADASIPQEENRLLVASTTIPAIVEVLQVRSVDKKPVKWTILEGNNFE